MLKIKGYCSDIQLSVVELGSFCRAIYRQITPGNEHHDISWRINLNMALSHKRKTEIIILLFII